MYVGFIRVGAVVLSHLKTPWGVQADLVVLSRGWCPLSDLSTMRRRSAVMIFPAALGAILVRSGTVLRLIWLPVLLLSVLSLALYFSAELPISMDALPWILLLAVVVGAAIATGWHRAILLGEAPCWYGAHLRFGRIGRYALRWVWLSALWISNRLAITLPALAVAALALQLHHGVCGGVFAEPDLSPRRGQ